jgi:hypothetical protein
MAKLNKTAGAIENCPSCKQQMVCNEIPGYQGGPPKLQWQNNEGKSHYLAKTFVDGKSTFPCRGVATTGSQSVAQQVQETKVNWNVLDEKSADMEQLVLGLDSMRSLAYEYTKTNHPDLSENSNIFGQIVNANITHLIALALVKATKEK